MENRKVVVFSTINTHSYTLEGLTKEWIDYRIDLFMKYTLCSLKSQTNQNFTTYVAYNNSSENLIMNSLSRHKNLPENVQFINYNIYNKTLESTLKDYEYLYLVFLDSDDMYHKSYIQQMHDIIPKEGTQVIMNQNGYLYNSINKHLANYYYPSSPFFTFIYNCKDFKNGIRYYTPGGHAGATKLPHIVINGFNFISHVHAKNTVNSFKCNNAGGLITDIHEVNKILKEFIGREE